MIRILVADDHAIVRKGFVQIINETDDMTVAGEAADGAEVIEKVQAGSYDVLVLDISMPRKSGVDTIKELRSVAPDLPVLVLSMHSEDQYALRVLKAGALGYLTKESAPDQLLTAIRRVASGQRYVTPQLGAKLAGFLTSDASRLPHETLSDREHQILLLIGSGKTVSQIAEELFLSVKTVSTHRSRILKKMGMKNNAELTKYALSNRLVE